jgi:hypothetical protein
MYIGKNKNVYSFIPNKIAIIVLIVFVLGFVSFGVFYSYKKKNNKKDISLEEKKIDVSLVDEKKTKEEFKDSDGDGVYDWIENLWPELDPNNPDSDGDGISDLKYIQRKKLIKEKQRNSTIKELNLTASQKLGRGVYMALLSIKQAGGTLDDVTEEQISKNIMDYISDLSLGSKIYIRDELHLVSDTKENSYKYRDKMKEFFDKNKINTSEIDLILRATKDPEQYMNDLESAAIKYDLYIHDLAAIDVPYIIAGRHAELLNAVGQLEGALKNLTQEEPDEITSLSSLVQMDKTMNSISDAIVNIEKYFEIIEDTDVFKK